ncbi:MFS transporter [Candidatus Micrarchaeota archaeon]|nr:MFS transporter [Candidatus Micrarchaeota archaeon]
MSLKKTRSRQLKQSISEGNAAAVMQGLGTDFVPAFALRLGADAAFIGLLSALPQLLHALAQFVSIRLGRVSATRLPVIRAGVFLQVVLWTSLAAISFFGFSQSLAFLLLVHALLTVVAGVINPFWTAWISDWVPEIQRGRFFAVRNKFTGFVLVFATFLGGLVLGVFESFNQALFGFGVLFVGASLARLVGLHFFLRSSERRHPTCPVVFPGWGLDLKQAPHFVHYVFYSSAYAFSVWVAAPFFVVYYLEDLGFSYPVYAALLTVIAFGSYLSMPYWGKMSDRLGSQKVLTYTALAIPLIPLAFLMPFHDAAYFFVIELFSGIFWAGQKLAAFNRLIEASPALRRPRFVAWYNVAVSASAFVGALAGAVLYGFFRENGFTVFGIHGLLWVFLVSAILRLATAILFLPGLRARPLPNAGQLNDYLKSVTYLPLKNMYLVLQQDAYSTVRVTGHGLRVLERREDQVLDRVEYFNAHALRGSVHKLRQLGRRAKPRHRRR